jgi:hypothetical protein
VAGYEALLADMGADIVFLRSELEARTEEIRRRDHIIAGLVGRVRALPVGGVDQDAQDVPQERDAGTDRGDWWRCHPEALSIGCGVY